MNKIKYGKITVLLAFILLLLNLIYYFPSKKDVALSDVAVNENMDETDEEINLGDTCYTSWVAGSWGGYSSGTTCSGSTLEPTATTDGTNYTQCEILSPGSSACTYNIANGCHRTRTWTRSAYTCTKKIDCWQLTQGRSCEKKTIYASSCQNMHSTASECASRLSCALGYHKEGLSCVQNECVIDSYTKLQLVSDGETSTVSVNVKDCKGKRVLISAGGANVVGNFSKEITTNDSLIQFSLYFYGNCNDTASYKISVTNGPSVTKSVRIHGKWNDSKNVTRQSAPKYLTKDDADKNNATEYGRNNNNGPCTKEGNNYKCDIYGWRYCSVPIDPISSNPPIPDPNPSCYADKPNIKEATKTKWMKERSTEYPYKISVIPNTNTPMTEATCIPMREPSFCEIATVAPYEVKDDLVAKRCERDTVTTYKDGIKCNGNSFYSVTCDNTMTVKYDSGDDENKQHIKDNYKMLTGQGFEFGMNITNTRSCEVKFDKTNWNAAYDIISGQQTIVNNKLRASNLSSSDKKYLESTREELNNKMNKLKQYVTDYKNLNLNKGIDFGANIGLKYETELKSISVSDNFIIEKDEAGSGKRVSDTVKNVSLKGGLSVQNYKWNNTCKTCTARTIKMKLPLVYLNRSTGETVKASEGNIDTNVYTDGGNKIYIDANAKTKNSDGSEGVKIPLNIKVYSPANSKSKNIEVANNKCMISIYRSDLIYRPISLDNPFINSTHEKGDNWQNKFFDFTKVITEATWSKNFLYDIVIKSSDIAALKKSNSDNRSSLPYLGLCDRIKPSMQDSITQRLCKCLNNPGTKCSL